MEIDEQVLQFEENSRRYRFIMKISGILTILSTIVSVYLIMFKSSENMQKYKWFLLRIVIICALFDLYLSLFYSPNILLPLYIVCSEGIAGNLKGDAYAIVLFIIIVALMVGVGFSVIDAFVYRLSSVARMNFKSGRPFLVLITVYFLLLTPICGFFVYAMLTSRKEVEAELDQYPAIKKFVMNRTCVYMSIKENPFSVLISTGLSMLENFASMVINFVLMFVILRRLKRDKHCFSKNTLAMHKQLTISLAFQFGLPSLFVMIPTLVIDTKILFENLEDHSMSQRLIQMLIILMSFHSPLNCLVMAFMVKPYKKAVGQFFYYILHLKKKPDVKKNSFSEPSTAQNQKIFTQRISMSDIKFIQQRHELF